MNDLRVYDTHIHTHWDPSNLDVAKPVFFHIADSNEDGPVQRAPKFERRHPAAENFCGWEKHIRDHSKIT